MTADAQRDQVFEVVVSKLASRLDMMHLEIFRCAAMLTAPTVSAENLSAKNFVGAQVQPNPRLS